MAKPLAISRRSAFGGLLLALVVIPSGAWAQAASSTRVRGTIERVDGQTLAVKSRGGSDVTIRLANDVIVSAVTKADWSDVKAGTFIGTAAVPGQGEQLRALEVHIFPESMRGAGEGHRDWDLGAKGSMTNGAVAQRVENVEGRVLTVKYPSGEKAVVVPPDAPIVLIGNGEKSDLKPGAKVMTLAVRQPDGTFQAGRIFVGKDGVEPPM